MASVSMANHNVYLRLEGTIFIQRSILFIPISRFILVLNLHGFAAYRTTTPLESRFGWMKAHIYLCSNKMAAALHAVAMRDLPHYPQKRFPASPGWW